MERVMLADIVRDLRRDTSIVALGQDADTLLLFCDQIAILSRGVLIGGTTTARGAPGPLARVA
jgi:ABC-type multidrug transport system ATPase subunit